MASSWHRRWSWRRRAASPRTRYSSPTGWDLHGASFGSACSTCNALPHPSCSTSPSFLPPSLRCVVSRLHILCENDFTRVFCSGTQSPTMSTAPATCPSRDTCATSGCETYGHRRSCPRWSVPAWSLPVRAWALAGAVAAAAAAAAEGAAAAAATTTPAAAATRTPMQLDSDVLSTSAAAAQARLSLTRMPPGLTKSMTTTFLPPSPSGHFAFCIIPLCMLARCPFTPLPLLFPGPTLLSMRLLPISTAMTRSSQWRRLSALTMFHKTTICFSFDNLFLLLTRKIETKKKRAKRTASTRFRPRRSGAHRRTHKRKARWRALRFSFTMLLSMAACG